MADRSLNDRVEILEQKVDALQTLPDRVTSLETQILQLRGETRVEFSAIREQFEQTQQQMRELHAEVLTRLHEGDEESRRQMRILHEEVLTRISLLQEGRARRRR